MSASSSTSSVKLSELINPTPRQREFLKAADSHKYTLYGGAAGGGKSYILRWWLLKLLIHIGCVYKVPHVKVGLFCEDYPTLKDRQLSKIATEFPAYLGKFVESRDEGYIFRLRPEFGGGMLMPRNLDDPSKYNSVEFAAIGVDELTRNKQDIFDELRKRLRWPGLPDDFKFPFAAGTNPGGIGHAWVKKLWIERDFPPELSTVEKEFAFVQAKAQDNPHNPKGYYSDLLTLPEDLRRAYAEGDWDMFAGQFFTKFRKELHVVRPFAIPSYWERFASFDWGFKAPASLHWHAVSPEGQVITYRELYVTGKTSAWIAQRAVELTGNEHLRYKVGDPSCWDASRGPSIAEVMANNGWAMVAAENDRKSGWARVREYLHWEKDAQGRLTRAPMWQCFSTCPALIRTLPSLVHDEHDVEDCDTKGEDHGPDDLRYGLMTRPKLSIVPLDVLPSEYRDAQIRAEHDERSGRRSGYEGPLD